MKQKEIKRYVELGMATDITHYNFEQALLDDRNTKQEIRKALEPTFANKYMEVFGIDVIENEICPQGCGFNLECKHTGFACEQCRKAFWNSPYEREYNLKH